MVKAFAEGRLAEAQSIHARLYPLFSDLFIEPNPVPIKTALGWLGRIDPEVRLPLCEITEAGAQKLRATLQGLDLVK